MEKFRNFWKKFEIGFLILGLALFVLVFGLGIWLLGWILRVMSWGFVLGLTASVIMAAFGFGIRFAYKCGRLLEPHNQGVGNNHRLGVFHYLYALGLNTAGFIMLIEAVGRFYLNLWYVYWFALMLSAALCLFFVNKGVKKEHGKWL